MPQNAWALSYLDVIALCDLAYAGNSDTGGRYFSAGKEWVVETVEVKQSFRAILVSGSNLRILSFSGSDDDGDWGMGGNLGNPTLGAENTAQYAIGLALAKKVKPTFYTGHSLGGGIALYCCCLTGVRTATINPSPIFNSMLGEKFERYNNTSLAINYCVDFEALAGGRAYANTSKIPFLGGLGPKQGATPGTRVTVETKAWDPKRAHLLEYLVGYHAPKRLWKKELKKLGY